MKSKILSILLIIMVISVGASVSFYKLSKTGSASATIAKPVVTVEGTSSFNINDVNEHTLGSGNTFIVKNYDSNNNITETEMKYYIEFVTTNIDISKLTLTLTRNGSAVTISNKKTPEFDLKIGAKQNDTFILKVKYNGSEDISNAKLSLKLHAYQVQPQ